MTIFYKAFCRTYQKVMYMGGFMLPWRSKAEQISGGGALMKLPAFLKGKGLCKPLIVTDETLVKLGLVQPLIDGLAAEGLSSVLYDKVVPNPTIDNIEDGLKLYKDNGCDNIIAFGGGSPMDCAKGIAARDAKPNKPVAKMKGILKILKYSKITKITAIPTTSGTGSEATLAAVISNPKTHEKYPINDPSLIPHHVVMDPLLTVGLPKPITSTTGMDALTHAVEAFIGSSNTKATKAQAIEATQLIFQYIKRAYDDGADLEARNKMQRAALLAGKAFTRAYVGYVHAMAHTLGGFYGVPHGLANSVILPHVLEAFGEKAYKKLAILADAVGIQGSTEQKAKAFIQAIRDLNASMDIPTRITGKWTIKEEDLPTMIGRAMKEANPLYPVPQIWNYDQFYTMFHKIM